MSEFKNIEELFKKQLQDAELNVRPELWDKVAQASGVAQPAFWTMGKIAAASIFTIAFCVGALFFFQNEKTNNPTLSVVDENTVKPIKNEVVTAVDNAEIKAETQIETKNPIAPKKTESLIEHKTLPEQANEPQVDVEKESINLINEGGSNRSDEKDQKLVQVDKKDPKELKQPKMIDKDDAVLDLEALEITQQAPKEESTERRYAPEIQAEKSLQELHFPEPFVKIFNPNVPGESGQFTVTNKDLGTFSIEIYNRSGKLIFKSLDPNFVWKGEQMDGSIAPEGTYIYKIFSTTSFGVSIKPQSGSVFLMRK